jgi:hypothetical protein
VTLAGAIAAQVVHHHLGAVLGQHQAMLAAHPTGTARHDRHAAFAQSRHCTLLSFACLERFVLR